MNNNKIADKANTYLEKGKYGKLSKLLLKNRDNEELFDILLNNFSFVNIYLYRIFIGDVFSKLSVNIQKKLIDEQPNLFTVACEDLKNDKEYIEQMQKKMDSGSYNREKQFSFYRYLGSELNNDAEYLLSIQDKSPVTFLDSIGRVPYSMEIIKDFFDKYPFYVASLPDNLKNDLDYAVSLIEKIPSETLFFYLQEMDYDYLIQAPIKNAIINKAGKKVYNQILLNSLSDNPKKLQNISFEEIKDIILLDPLAFASENNVGTLFALRNQKDIMTLIKSINKVSKTTFNKINSPSKLSKLLFELSSSFKENLSYENINKMVEDNWEQILPWVEQIDETHKMLDGTISPFENYDCFYKIYNLLIGIESNKLGDMFKVFMNSELRNSRFAEGIKNITVTDDNLYFLQLICTSNLFNSDNNTISFANKIFLKISDWNNNPYETVDFIERLFSDSKLVNILKNTNIDVLDNTLLLNVYNYVRTGLNVICPVSNLAELKDFNKFIDFNIEKIPNDNINDKKHRLLLQFFQIDLTIAKDVLHSYLSSDANSSLYKNNPDILYLKQALEKIVFADNIETLNQIEMQLSNQNSRVTFVDIENTINKIKISYGKEIKDSLFKTDKASGVIDVSDIDFNLLVHIVGAYGETPDGDIYESWNSKERTSSTSISTSFISSDNLGTALMNSHSVILGFADLPDDYLEVMSSMDMVSADVYSRRQSKFLNSKELKDNTRHGHNEIVTRRRKGKFTEEKLQPSYIVCFDQINDESRVASEKFGIPIIFIDRERVALRQHTKILNMIEEFKTTLNPNLIASIVCEQENNRAGLRLGRPDLVEQYFSTDFRQQNINTLYDYIKLGLEKGEPNAIEAMKAFVSSIESEREKFVVSKDESPQRASTFDIEYEELVEDFKNNKMYNSEKVPTNDLSSFEAYKKFIECRKKLSLSESMELQEINMKNASSIEYEDVNLKGADKK